MIASLVPPSQHLSSPELRRSTTPWLMTVLQDGQGGKMKQMAQARRHTWTVASSLGYHHDVGPRLQPGSFFFLALLGSVSYKHQNRLSINKHYRFWAII